MQKVSNNIFDYATTELSQDAFICWLVSHLGSSGPLRDVAKDLIRTVHERYFGVPIAAEDVRGLIPNKKGELISKQFQRADVHFVVDIKGEPISFTFEDKIHTAHHSDQLRVYPERIKRVYGDEIHKHAFIYFKTGYVLEEESPDRLSPFVLFDLRDIHGLLEWHDDIANQIFQSYLEHIRGQMMEMARLDTYVQKNDVVVLGTYWGQYDLMRRIKMTLPPGFTFKAPTKQYALSLYKGNNKDGSPWTQLSFYSEAVPYRYRDGAGGKEELMWRLDRYEGKHYLALQQYSRIDKADADSCTLKSKRLDELRREFHSISGTLRFIGPDKLRRPNRGQDECSVAQLFFDENSIGDVLVGIPKVHVSFLKVLDEMG